MVKNYAAEAIVLKRSNFGESDRLVTFLSKYKGKFTAIAKGARKVASRRNPNLELFNHVKAYFASGRNLDVVTEVQTIRSFKDVKGSLGKVGYGFYLVEIVNGFLEEGQGGRYVFDLLLETLDKLEKVGTLEDTKKTLRAFEIKFLDYVGYRPQLYQCTVCHRKTRGEAVSFLPGAGGVAHTKCRANNLFAETISQDGLKVLRFLQSEQWPRIARLKIPRDINLELEKISRSYLEYLLEKDLKSIEFINKVKSF